MRDFTEKGLFGFLILLTFNFSIVQCFAQEYCTPVGTDSINVISEIRIGELLSDTANRYEQMFFRPMEEEYYRHIVDSSIKVSTAKDFQIGVFVSDKWKLSSFYHTLVYIDWNKDGDFEDFNEEIYNSLGLLSPPFIAYAKRPKEAEFGDYRLRIRFKGEEGGIVDMFDPCTGDEFGEYAETIDFEIRLVGDTLSRESGNAGEFLNHGFETGKYDDLELFTGWHSEYCASENECGCCEEIDTIRNDTVNLPIEGEWNGRTYVKNRFSVVSHGMDPMTTLISRVNDGSHSIRLGNASPGYQAEQMRFKFTVPEENPVFVYSYAIVMDEPGHFHEMQPYFEAKFVDAHGRLIPCTYRKVTSGNSTDPFDVVQKKGHDNLIHYKDWEKVYVPLYEYKGEDIFVEFEVADCAHGAHFGYAYVDTHQPPTILKDEPDCGIGLATLSLSYVPENYSVLWSNGESTPDITFDPLLDTNAFTVTLLPADSSSCEIYLDAVVTIPDSIETGDYEIQCNDDDTYTVAFPILQGDASSITSNEGTITHGVVPIFVSNPIPISSTAFSITVTGNGGCVSATIEGSHACSDDGGSTGDGDGDNSGEGGPGDVDLVEVVDTTCGAKKTKLKVKTRNVEDIQWAHNGQGEIKLKGKGRKEIQYKPVPEDFGKIVVFYVDARVKKSKERVIDSMGIFVQIPPKLDEKRIFLEACAGQVVQIPSIGGSGYDTLVWSVRAGRDENLLPGHNGELAYRTSDEEANRSVKIRVIAEPLPGCKKKEYAEIVIDVNSPVLFDVEEVLVCKGDDAIVKPVITAGPRNVTFQYFESEDADTAFACSKTLKLKNVEENRIIWVQAVADCYSPRVPIEIKVKEPIENPYGGDNGSEVAFSNSSGNRNYSWNSGRNQWNRGGSNQGDHSNRNKPKQCVDEKEEKWFVNVPDMITPDGDGEADELIIGHKGIRVCEFTILNEKHQTVYHTNDLRARWNGKDRYKSKGLYRVNRNVIVYAYKLRGRTVDGQQVNLTGQVWVVRK